MRVAPLGSPLGRGSSTAPTAGPAAVWGGVRDGARRPEPAGVPQRQLRCVLTRELDTAEGTGVETPPSPPLRVDRPLFPPLIVRIR
eukprot:85051-Pyramimonas_sp.AAC.1